jgi:hypothetical protein
MAPWFRGQFTEGRVGSRAFQPTWTVGRYSNIKTTMDYYANVDAAVEAAVLGPERNSSRNAPSQNGTTTESGAGATDDVTMTSGDTIS